MISWIRRQQAGISARMAGHIPTRQLLAFHDAQDGADRRLHAEHLEHCPRCVRELAAIRKALSLVAPQHPGESEAASLRHGRQRLADAMSAWISEVPSTVRAEEEVAVYLGSATASPAQPAELVHSRLVAFLGARTAAELRRQLLLPSHSAP